MRIFYRGEGGTLRFWSIAQEGKRLTICHGKEGSPGRTQTIRHASIEMAMRDRGKRIQEKLRQGYVERIRRDPMLEVLESDLIGNPEDLAAHMAYADWLSEQNEEPLRARGEFIQVQLGLEDPNTSEGERRQLRQREAELLQEYRETWLGDLQSWFSPEQEPRSMIRFARGWIDSLRIDRFHVALARSLVRAPQLCLLRRLEILGCEMEFAETDYAILEGADAHIQADYPALSVLRQAKQLSNVTCLALGDTEGEFNFCTYPSAEKLDEVLPIFPKLRELHLNICDLQEANVLQLPMVQELRVLRLERVRLYDAGAAELARGRWPHLEVLQLWNARITDDGARMLAKNKSLRKLKLLDVSFNWMTEKGISALRKLGVPVVAEYQMQPTEDHDDEYTDDGWHGPGVVEEEFALDAMEWE